MAKIKESGKTVYAQDLKNLENRWIKKKKNNFYEVIKFLKLKGMHKFKKQYLCRKFKCCLAYNDIRFLIFKFKGIIDFIFLKKINLKNKKKK